MRKRMIMILLAMVMLAGCGGTAEKCAEARKDMLAVGNSSKTVHGSTVTVLAFGQQEPDCFRGAKYDVICEDCGEILDIVYREPCTRCGAEWSEAYGQVLPHTWVKGIRKETDWENGGNREVPYLYCSVCGKRQEQSQ